MENQYFNEALSGFARDFAYGGAIRHLVDRGYTVERIIREFHYPISDDAVRKIVDDYRKKKKTGAANSDKDGLNINCCRSGERQ